MYVFVCLPAPTQASRPHCLEQKHRISLGADKKKKEKHKIWINMKILMGLNAAANDTRVLLIPLFVLFLKIPLALLKVC